MTNFKLKQFILSTGIALIALTGVNVANAYVNLCVPAVVVPATTTCDACHTNYPLIPASIASYNGLCAVVGVPAPTSNTNVSGPITINTVWTAALAPYTVTGDVTVQSSAVLTIEPGVVVRFSPNTNLIVAAGSLVARGTPVAPIVLTSTSDVTGGTPIPGGWGQVRFMDGTVDVGTTLDYVQVKYGSGVVLQAASPTLNHLTINNNNGAAISMDLQSSPTGVGNQASGNTLNGISVPSGDVVGTTSWKLKGIPYVLSSGVISVGQSPSLGALNPNTIQPGETINLNLTGTRLDGVESILFDDPGLIVTVLSGATSTTVPLSITASPAAIAGAKSLNVQVAAGKVQLVSALTVVGTQPKITVLTPTSVYAGQTGVTLNVTGINFAATSLVQMDGTDLPTTFVTASTVNATLPLLAAGAHTITIKTPDATTPGSYFISNTAGLSAIAPYFTLSPTTLSLVRGNTGSFTVTMPYPAPVGGLIVTLVSTVPTVATVPASVTIAAGTNSASFTVTSVGDGTANISASHTGFTSAASILTVIPPPTVSITPSSTTIGIGLAAQLTVATNAPAGVGGIIINLVSSNTAVATIPASVTIPQGATSATVTATSTGIGTATMTASTVGFLSGTSTMTVRPLSINLPSALLISPGLSRSMAIILSDPAPVGGLPIALNSSNPAAATVPASVTIAEGQTLANVTVTGVAIGTTTLSAVSTGYQSGSSAVTVDTVNITFSPVGAVSLPATVSKPFSVFISRPAPTGGVSIVLTSADPTIATLTPATILIPEGQTSGGTVVATLTGVAKGVTSMAASSPGLNGTSAAITITGQPTLRFRTFNGATSVTVGKGFRTYLTSWYNQSELYVERMTDTSYYYGPDNLVVTLQSSDPTKATVPVTITIPAGSASLAVQVTGVDLTNGVPISLDAMATNYVSPAVKMPVNTIAPTLQLVSLDTARSTLSNRDDFYIQATVPGSNWPTFQTAVAATPVNLSVTNASTTGIVQFYDAATAGNLITQTTFAVDASTSATAYVGQPAVTGSYTVTAGIPTSNTSVTSGVVTVSPSNVELRFRTYNGATSVTAGKGLTTYYYSYYNSSELYVDRYLNGVAYPATIPLTVTLTSSDPTKATVPTTVTIPANQSSVAIQVTGVDLTNGVSITLDATASSYISPTTKMPVNVIAPTLVFSGLATVRNTLSARDDFQVYASVPGSSFPTSHTAAAAIPVNLSVTNASTAGIVQLYDAATAGNLTAQTTVAAVATFSSIIYVGQPTTTGTYTVMADAPSVNASNASGVVTVNAPALGLDMKVGYSTGSTRTTVVGKGLSTNLYEIYLIRALDGALYNGPDPLMVTLTNSDSTRVSVPASVVIPANNCCVNFTVSGVDITNGVPVTIDAVATGYVSPINKFTVNTIVPTLQILNLDTPRNTLSARDDFMVRAYVPGANSPYSQTPTVASLVNLSITNATPAGIAQIYDALTAGNLITQTTWAVNATNTPTTYVDMPTTTGSYTVTADFPAGGAAVTSGIVSVAPPDLRLGFYIGSQGNGYNTALIGNGLRDSNYIYVYRTLNGANYSSTTALSVSLTCNAATICNVPATVTIPANAYSVVVPVTGVGVGTTTITPTATGYTASVDLPVSVITPSFAYYNAAPPATLKVAASSNFNMSVAVPGAYGGGSQTVVNATTLSVISSAPGIASVTSTVTIPAAASVSGYATVTGVAAGAATVTTSATNFTPLTSPVITVSP